MADWEISNPSKLKLPYPDCWRWMRLARRLPGPLTEREASALFRLARARTPAIEPRIAENGAVDPQAGFLLAAALSGKVHPKLFIADSTLRDRERWNCKLERRRLDIRVEVADAPPERCIDILVIHAGEEIDPRRELALWSRALKLDGIVVLYGVSPESAAEIFQPPQYRDVRQIENLVWAVNWCAPPLHKQSSGNVLEQSQEAMLHLNPIPAFSSGDAATAFAAARLQDYMGRAAVAFAEERHAVKALRNSSSWRLTAPLRWTMEAFQALAGLATAFRHGPAKSQWNALRQWVRFRKQVRNSGLFDEHAYRVHAPAAWARTNPLLHFFLCGATEGRNPNELFDLRYYLERYPDVAGSGLNPLVHYLNYGARKGYDPCPYFESSFYLEQNPDVRDAGLNPLAHYLAPGIAEGRDPNPWFDTSEYLEQNPDVATFGLNPLTHQLGQFPHVLSRNPGL